MLAKNKSGWILIKYVNVEEDDIAKYQDVTGAYAIVRVGDKYLIGYNRWRKQWEFPAGGIEDGETAREAAVRELYEETHQRNSDLIFKGLFQVEDAKGNTKYQAVFVGWQDGIVPFVHNESDEMEKVILWDMEEEIGYVDECDVKIAQMVFSM